MTQNLYTFCVVWPHVVEMQLHSICTEFLSKVEFVELLCIEVIKVKNITKVKKTETRHEHIFLWTKMKKQTKLHLWKKIKLMEKILWIWKTKLKYNYRWNVFSLSFIINCLMRIWWMLLLRPKSWKVCIYIVSTLIFHSSCLWRLP